MAMAAFHAMAHLDVFTICQECSGSDATHHCMSGAAIFFFFFSWLASKRPGHPCLPCLLLSLFACLVCNSCPVCNCYACVAASIHRMQLLRLHVHMQPVCLLMRMQVSTFACHACRDRYAREDRLRMRPLRLLMYLCNIRLKHVCIATITYATYV
jgi:hypothetical protein